MYYDFQFLPSKEALQSTGTAFWFEVGKILELREPADVNDFLIDHGLGQKSTDVAKFANRTMFKLYEVFHKTRVINYYLETSQELDKVLRIFIRVNSGGTQLKYSDMLLSIATAQWKTRDAREEITTFVDEINRIGQGFVFDKDFVLKSCLVLSDIADIAFKVDNFNMANTKTIETKWEDLTNGLRVAIELISSFGYNLDTLTSTNAVIPIAYYILKLGNPSGFVLSVRYKDDREKIRKWLMTSLLKRTFSGTPDNVLRPIREIIKKNPSGFPLPKIVDEFKGTPKSITFTEDDIQGLLDWEYGKPYTFSVLSLLYPSFDFRKRFHEDHIFPKKLFNKPELKKRGIPESDWETFQEMRNRIGNLQLLEGLPNQEKSSKDFKDWIESTCHGPDERKQYTRTHLIPDDADLSLKKFPEFVSKRNALIKQRLKEVLQTS